MIDTVVIDTVVHSAAHSISKHFKKKLIYCSLFIGLFLHALFVYLNYRHFEFEISKTGIGIDNFVQEMLRVSYEIQKQERNYNDSSLDEILDSVVVSNPFILGINISPSSNEDISIHNLDSKRLLLKTNIKLRNDRLTGLDIYIKKDTIKPYMKNLQDGYNYYFYSNKSLLTSFEFAGDEKNNQWKYNFFTKIENSFIKVDAKVEIPMYTIFTTYAGITMIVILILLGLYFFMFYGYKTVSKHNIELPLSQYINMYQQSESEKLTQEIKDMDDKREKLANLKKLVSDEKENPPPTSKKGHLKLVK